MERPVCMFMSVERFLNAISFQIRDCISHGRVSYWEEEGSYYGEDLLCLIFQGDIYDYGETIIFTLVQY